MQKRAILISIPLVWGIRNAINSRMIDLLTDEINIFVAVPPAGVQSMSTLGFLPENVLSLCIPDSNRLSRIILQTLKNVHKVHKSTLSDRIFSEWFGSNQKLPRKTILALTCRTFENPTRFVWLEKYFLKRMAAQVPSELAAQVARIKPVAALSTSYVMNWEWPLFKLLQDKKVPTATHILSFDNFSSRGYFPITGFDQYYTWQQRMSEELTYFFGINRERIKITGTPQFDFHVLPEFHCDRHKTTTMLGIDPERPYLAYCANHLSHTPHEPELIRFLISTLKGTQNYKNYQWVIRLHPMDQYKRWEKLFSSDPDVVINHPWSRDDSNAYWALPTNEELALLSNTLRHAVATITMASTTALDSCVVDTPVICVGFHPNLGSLEDRYYREVHYSHHYEPIIKSGAVSLSRSKDEFIIALDETVNQRFIRSAERKALVSQLCGLVDGKAAHRIVESLVTLANK